MINLRKYSYVILWIALILTVAVVWFFAKKSKPADEKTVDANISSQENNSSSQNSSNYNSSAQNSSNPSSSLDSSNLPSQENNSSEESTVQTSSLNDEMIGLWIPFMSLTTPEKTEDAFKENFKKIADSAKAKGINALFVHVRPYSDALYPSSVYPWSHIVTGQQGTNPNYDPMQFMIEYTHSLDMQFHAWINPLRVKTGQTGFELSADNIYNQLKNDYPYYFMEYDGGVYLNPAYPYTRKLIADGAAEIAANYDVDGIHFDDYFYPSEDASLDSSSYTTYVESISEPLSLEKWRTANVNTMVAEVYQRIKAENKNVVFGISPSGNIANNEKMNADIKTWCAVPGYIDYICPQIYYSYENPSLGFITALEQWMALPKHSNLKTYIGLALYKAGSDKDNGTWQLSSRIIAQQIADSRSANSNGVILYSSDYLDSEQTRDEVVNAVAEINNN